MKKEVFKELIREKKLNLSYPRLLVYEELSSASSPLTPQDLYHGLNRKKRKIGLTSIYRCLGLFESLGIVFKITDRPSVRYKFCQSENHHHHIVCKQCGRVVELDFCDMSAWSKKVSESTGYEVTEHHLSFFGFCQDCRKR